MAEIINLRTARKRKARDQASAKADQNRVTFGRTKTEKALTKAKSDQAARLLDGHKLDEAE
ncbi:hypothetical protein VW29_14640 [Devosia limi DSM 17137]|uniref:Uncharacterized protein n=1 Tax=Devosia limi DSM 17137 TaxID=1121477 RepID=A0A0F5LMB7_9HYPH|nr:DUF4169 family protein [Devosia limi]KKB82802.1 hypothetical protein VW29_14640 [Devosia limi DSM 17137]SHF47817.1 protein of unknown function [Devosia limi DSM 17137]